MTHNEEILYRSSKPVITAEYDPSGSQTLVVVIANAIAAAAEANPIDLPPLHMFVDTDALNALFAREDDSNRTELHLHFRVDCWNVFVNGDGRIQICDASKVTGFEPVFQPGET